MNLHTYTFIGISAFRFFEWMAKMYSCKLKLKSVLKKKKEKVTRKKIKLIGTYLYPCIGIRYLIGNKWFGIDMGSTSIKGAINHFEYSVKFLLSLSKG